MTVIFWIVIFLFTVILHEVCHGLAAYYLGDPTAKQAGRITLNPVKHIDPLWTVLLPGILFFMTGGRFAIGMAKPVPVNFSLLRPRRAGMMIVAFAGPLANFILAGLLAWVFHQTGQTMFLMAVYLNLGLAFFNLVPIPPLDGSRLVLGLLPDLLAKWFIRIERFGFLIILALYFSGILFAWILPPLNAVCRILNIPLLRMTF